MEERQDRRALRNRSALMAAAVRLVTEAGTTAVPVGVFTDAATVSRQLVYLQFGDRDGLLVAAAADLVERELLPALADPDQPMRVRMLAMARHFAGYREFYRAMLTGSCAFAMTRVLHELFGALITPDGLRGAFGDLDPAVIHDLRAFVTGGAGTIVSEWLAGDDPGPLDPDRLTARLVALADVVRIRGAARSDPALR
ncbi:TetR/AcrR family transcriptional regulator [Actinoplanes rectilineatus]|uniref:TetR/AcrR family transcriptional regulator n=1 Tax=Actinoplanes rectilineatus TaxID=113571 RepID=UPI0005F2BF9D|nr:TetR/AcrR family transcriptional regulator [Actinoplanes rectilineatus]